MVFKRDLANRADSATNKINFAPKPEEICITDLLKLNESIKAGKPFVDLKRDDPPFAKRMMGHYPDFRESYEKRVRDYERSAHR